MFKVKVKIENVSEEKIIKMLEKFGKKTGFQWKINTKNNVTILECELLTIRSKFELFRRLRLLKGSKIIECETEKVLV